MQPADIKLVLPGTSPARVTPAPVRTIAVTSGVGGIGKTNIAVNLALALAQEGQRVMLLDAGPGVANVNVLLGLKVEATLENVLSGEQRLEEVIVNGPGDLMIVPVATGTRQLAELGMTECAGIVRAFSDLPRQINTLIIDTATGTSHGATSFCGAAGNVLVVVGNDPASLRDSTVLIRRLHSEYAIAHFHVLANMVLTAREGSEVFRKLLGLLDDDHGLVVSYAGFIPYDDTLRNAVLRHQAVVDACPRSRSSMALRNLAWRVSNWPRPNAARGNLEFFVERLVQQNNVEMEVMS